MQTSAGIQVKYQHAEKVIIQQADMLLREDMSCPFSSTPANHSYN